LRNSNILPLQERETLDHYYRNFRNLRSERLRWAYDRQLEEMMQLISSKTDLRVLEVGSGCGTESLWFAMHGARVSSIDIKEDRLSVERARQALLEDMLGRSLECQFARQSLLEIDGSERYDVIWVQQTFHHLEPRAECVASITRLLKRGGAVVMSEVNAWNPLIQLMLLRRRGVRTIVSFKDSEGRIIPYGNERILAASALARWFRRFGLRRHKVCYYRLLPSHPMFDALGGIERRLSGPTLKPFYTHYNFVAWKPLEAE
jgi:2-polyprenyl-3-methyl-5-hydroxy-6-metoxy-1,4-benzoquinol methylase